MSPEDIRDKYKAFGKKLRSNLDQSAVKSREQMEIGLEKLKKEFGFVGLPSDLQEKILTAKDRMEIPLDFLPDEFYKRPFFFGKKDFYRRLATDFYVFGISSQRAFGRILKTNELLESFNQKNPSWDCSEKDLKRILGELANSDLVTTTEGQVLFEPMETSLAVASIFRIAASQNPPSVTIDLLIEELNLDKEYAKSILKKLSKEGMVRADRETYWFPALG